jgi:hypothetical protein
MDMMRCFVVSSKKRLDKIIPSISKGLVMYNKKHGTTSMSGHVSIEHFVMLNLCKDLKTY